MTFRRAVSLVMFVLLASMLSNAQGTSRNATSTGEIQGQIRFADGRPAPMGIGVYLDQREGGGNMQTQTDRSGKFTFTDVERGRVYVIRLHAPGYLADTQEVDLMGVGMAYLNIVIKPDPKNPPPAAVPPGGPGASVSAVDANAPENARKDLEGGRDLLTQGTEIDKALEFFQKAVSEYPQYSEAYLLMGMAYSSQKKWPDAEKSLQKSISLNKNNAGAFVALGAVQNEQQNYAAAEKSLNQAIVMSPDSADAQFELGRTYWGLQRWADADQHVAKANTLRPDNSGQRILMGNILLRERNAPGALEQYKKAVELDPNGPFADSARQMVTKIEAALRGSNNKPSN